MMKKIRKSIQQNMLHKMKTFREDHTEYLPNTEESHGFVEMPQQQHHQRMEKNQPPIKRPSSYIHKWIMSMLLFVCLTVVCIWNDIQTPIGKMAYSALTDDFPFATAYDWYEKNVHTLSFLNQFSPDVHLVDDSFSPDEVVETFQATGTGITISPEKETTLFALADGVVVFAGMDRHTNRTIVVQHADQSKAIYGHLSTIDVPLYKRVKKHEAIGTFSRSTTEESYYMSIQKAGEYIDPYVYMTELNNE